MKGKVLLACLDALGDLVLASSLIAPLREAFPGGVGLWVKEYVSGLAPFLGADFVFYSDPFWDRSFERGRGSLRRWLDARRKAAEAGFEAAVVSSLSWKVAAGVASCGIPRRVGFGGGKRKLFLTDPVSPPRPDEPALSSLARLLIPLGAREDGLELSLDPAPFLSPAMQSLRAALPEGPLAALHPFAGGPSRCVALEEWVKTADALKTRGFRILWIGSPSEIKALGAPRPGEFFSCDFGGGSLGALGSLLMKCSFLIGHDSGPLHLAAALGLKVAGVFAPGEPLRTFPQGRAASVLLRAENPALIDAEKIIKSLPPPWMPAAPKTQAASRPA